MGNPRGVVLARCARLQIQNHGIQQREINNARDTNGDGNFEISGCCFVCHFEILGILFGEG